MSLKACSSSNRLGMSVSCTLACLSLYLLCTMARRSSSFISSPSSCFEKWALQQFSNSSGVCSWTPSKMTRFTGCIAPLACLPCSPARRSLWYMRCPGAVCASVAMHSRARSLSRCSSVRSSLPCLRISRHSLEICLISFLCCSLGPVVSPVATPVHFRNVHASHPLSICFSSPLTLRLASTLDVRSFHVSFDMYSFLGGFHDAPKCLPSSCWMPRTIDAACSWTLVSHGAFASP